MAAPRRRQPAVDARRAEGRQQRRLLPERARWEEEGGGQLRPELRALVNQRRLDQRGDAGVGPSQLKTHQSYPPWTSRKLNRWSETSLKKMMLHRWNRRVKPRRAGGHQNHRHRLRRPHRYTSQNSCHLHRLTRIRLLSHLLQQIRLPQPESRPNDGAVSSRRQRVGYHNESAGHVLTHTKNHNFRIQMEGRFLFCGALYTGKQMVSTIYVHL